MLQDSIEKYKKVSFFKNHHQKETENLYYMSNDTEPKSERSINRKSIKSITSITSKSNKLNLFSRERDQDKINITETKLTNTNDTSTILANANAYHNQSSQNLEKFKKNKKLLFFRSRDRSNHSTNSEARGVSFSVGGHIQTENDKDKTNPFITNQSLTPRNKQNLDHSLIGNTKKQSFILDKMEYNQYTDMNSKVIQQTPINSTAQIKNKFILSGLKLNLPKSHITTVLNQINENQAVLNNPQVQPIISNTNEHKTQEIQLLPQKDSIIEDFGQLSLPKQTSLQKMITRIYHQPPQAIKETRKSIESPQLKPGDITPQSPSKSPLTKKLDIISKKFKESPRKDSLYFNEQPNNNDKILISNFLDSQDKRQHQMKKTLTLSKRQESQNSIQNHHQLSVHSFKADTSYINGSLSARDGSNSPLKVPQINNLLQYSKYHGNRSNQQTPLLRERHFNPNIQRQLKLNKPQNLQEGSQTASHVLIRTEDGESKSSLNGQQNRVFSKTPAERLYRNVTSINVIEPSVETQKSIQLINSRTSNIFSNYVALTFKNNLLELRKRTQLSMIQRLSFESRQALKRLVIYINDMQQEYGNIKKVSQVIYQLIYHIPYIVNMLFQKEKILLRERIDLTYISLFLTNRSNMNLQENKGVPYEQLLDNKIQIDIVFLNEKLSEYIKKKFQDRFQLISQSIIQEHDKVYNLEKEIEEKIAKTQRLPPNPNKKLLKQKHNYSNFENYMFHAKNKNQNTFAQTFYKETKRLGDFNCVDLQNVQISHELDNLYNKVQIETLNKQDNDPFEIFDKQKKIELEDNS